MGFEKDNVYPMVIPPIGISNFAGGFKFSESLFDLKLNESPDCFNVYYRDGTLFKMDGTSKRISNALSGSPKVSGLFVYGQESSGTIFVLAAAGTQVFVEDSGDWTDITGENVSFTDGAQHFGLTFNDIFIGLTDKRDKPYKKDGNSDLELLGGDPPSGKVLGRIGEFIVIGNTSSNPSRAFYSSPGNPEGNWNRFWDTRSSDTQGLTAVGSLDQRSGFLFKEKTADRIMHRGGLSFQHDREYLPVGIVAQATLQKCTLIIGQGLAKKSVDVLIGLSDEGVYAFDGSKSPILISDNISFKFDRNNFESWNRSQWSQAHATYDPTRHWYWLWVPSSTSAGQMDELWICDLETFVWWPMNPDHAASSAIIDDSNDDPQMHIGTYDGFVKQFSRTNRSYDGSAINSFWFSRIIDFKQTIRLRQFIPVAKQQGDWSLTFRTRWGLAHATTSSDSMLLRRSGTGIYGTGVYGTATYGPGRPVYTNMAGLNRTGRYLQLEIAHNTLNQDFTLDKIELPARIIGRRVGEYR